MPSPTPQPTRAALWAAHRQGTPPAELASRFGLAPRTVRHLLRLSRRAGGPAPRPARPPGRPRDPAGIAADAVAIRRDHPGWGACVIRLRLLASGRWPDVPQPRTIQRWLAAAGLGPARPGRRSPHSPRAAAPHDRWQVDAKDQLTLAGGSRASWLRATDECSGAVLGTTALPSVWNDVPASDTQRRLRALFGRWGLPLELRLDNGFPWGNWSGLPTGLGLWLAGLGVRLHYNDPRSPRQNAVVERSHGVSGRWAEPGTCADAAELQARLDEFDEMQRSAYPGEGGLTRAQRYPGLAHSGRPYSEAEEGACWDLGKARAYLAGHVASRRVSVKGQVGVYARRYQVGRVNAGRRAWAQYDAEANEWMFGGDDGVTWCRHNAEQVTREAILSLHISAKPSRHGKDFCPD